MGLLKEFLKQKSYESPINEVLRSYVFLVRIRTGKDISDELLDELANLRFDIRKETSIVIFDTLNTIRGSFIERKIFDENIKMSTLRVNNINRGNFISMLGDILEIGTFVGVREKTTNKVKLAKGIFYAK